MTRDFWCASCETADVNACEHLNDPANQDVLDVLPPHTRIVVDPSYGVDPGEWEAHVAQRQAEFDQALRDPDTGERP